MVEGMERGERGEGDERVYGLCAEGQAWMSEQRLLFLDGAERLVAGKGQEIQIKSNDCDVDCWSLLLEGVL